MEILDLALITLVFAIAISLLGDGGGGKRGRMPVGVPA